MFITGTIQGETYSYLSIGTTADIDGSLQVVLQPELFGYLPRPGDSFDLVTAAAGITLQPGFSIRTLMTAQGAAYLGLSLPTYSSGFAADPNQLVALPQELFQYSLVNGGTTLRVTMIQPVACRTPPAPSDALTCPSGSASLSIPFGSGPPASYQWQYRGSDGLLPTDWTDLTEGVNVISPTFSLIATGTTTTTLSVARDPTGWPTMGIEAGGLFRCTVTDVCGSTPTAAARLAICKTDVNCSQSLTVQDIFDFLTIYFSGTAEGDFNDSGVISVQDIFDFLAAYFAGCA